MSPHSSLLTSPCRFWTFLPWRHLISFGDNFLAWYGWVKQEWCTAGFTYSLLNSKKQPWENVVMAYSLECCDHEAEFKFLGGVKKENSRVKIFTQETVVWVPWEAALKGKWSQESVRSVRTAFFRQKKFCPSNLCWELYPKILRK